MNEQQKKIISEILKDLINYYDDIQFQIDIEAQMTLSVLEYDKSRTSDEVQARKKYLLATNETMTTLVKETLESNLKRINEYKFENDTLIKNEQSFKENLKKIQLKSFCFYAKRGDLKWNFSEKNMPLGFILITDWYLDKKQLDFLSSKITTKTSELQNDDFVYWNLNSDILNLCYGIFKFDPHYNQISKFEGSILKINKQQIINDLLSVEKLDLSRDYDFYAIETNTFQHLINLRNLNISNTKTDVYSLKEINSNTFNGLSKLEILNLSNNRINAIQPNSFNQLVNLKQLYISHNNLHKINQSLLNGLENRLEKFEFTSSQETYMSDLSLLKTFNKLKSLGIVFGDMSLFKADAFNSLGQLNSLEIEAYKIEKFEDHPFRHFANLLVLEIKIFEMPIVNKNMFKGLKNLEVLNLGAVLYNSSDIGDFIIDDDAFESLKSLKKLSIWIFNLPKLCKKLTNGLENLENLDIYMHNLKKIERNTFKPLKSLKSFTLLSYKEEWDNHQLQFLSCLSDEQIKEYFEIAPQRKIKFKINNHQ